PINSARISTALLRSCIVRTKHERRARHDTSIDPGATADGPAVSGASPDRRAARGPGPTDRDHVCSARRDLRCRGLGDGPRRLGRDVVAGPPYLPFLGPAQAVQIAISLSTALSCAGVSGLRRTIAPALLLRLGVGSLAGLPFGLFSFRYADRLLVRLGAGATILAFAVMMAGFRFRGSRGWAPFARTQTGDLAAGAVAGVATALVGMAGPPVLIYLLLAGTAAQTVRAT